MILMKCTEFILNRLKMNGVEHCFGYPGGMIADFMQEIATDNELGIHLQYNEQGSSLVACGYSQIKKKLSVVFVSSGPGATNLITGICNAWFDSIPVLFITGQVNVNEMKNNYNVRQKGFQETDIISMVKDVTKYSKQVISVDQLEDTINEACKIAVEGRKGPVVIDIPMNIFRSEIEYTEQKTVVIENHDYNDIDEIVHECYKFVQESKKPCILLGNGANYVDNMRLISVLKKFNAPVVTSLIGIDLLLHTNPLKFGFIGAYGSRIANNIINNSDGILVIGSRLDTRQTGVNTDLFAPNARILRIDIDQQELDIPIKKTNMRSIYCDSKILIDRLYDTNIEKLNNSDWLNKCNQAKRELQNIDIDDVIKKVGYICDFIQEDTIITTDVGQNQIWVAQSIKIKKGQKLLFSAGHGTMGYSLPAAIGACIANNRKTTVSFNGDGGFQMNIQELQAIVNEKLPIKIIILNNKSLGMIRHFQELYFDNNYVLTTKDSGYGTPDFKKIGTAYGIKSMDYIDKNNDDLLIELLKNSEPCIINILLPEVTCITPKGIYNESLSNQHPYLQSDLMKKIRDILN